MNIKQVLRIAAVVAFVLLAIWIINKLFVAAIVVGVMLLVLYFMRGGLRP